MPILYAVAAPIVGGDSMKKQHLYRKFREKNRIFGIFFLDKMD